MRVGITDGSGVPGENGNGRRVVDFCAERGLCVGNAYLEHKNSLKYTRVARGQDEVEVKSMIYQLLVKKHMLLYVQEEGKGKTILRSFCSAVYSQVGECMD